jgi:hypothetical protein
MRTHTGERPYACDFESCEKKFKTYSQLKYHKSIHYDKRQYKCEECHLGFNRKSTLNIHILTHSGMKPFKCLYCTKTFSQKSNWKKHIDNHLIVSIVLILIFDLINRNGSKYLKTQRIIKSPDFIFQYLVNLIYLSEFNVGFG